MLFISVTTYGGIARLSTTQTTTATITRGRGSTAPPPLNDMQILHGEVVGANATCIHKCPKGHSLQTITSPMTHCLLCPPFYKTVKLHPQWEATITIEHEWSSFHTHSKPHAAKVHHTCRNSGQQQTRTPGVHLLVHGQSHSTHPFRPCFRTTATAC